jgi:hypothetical protein
MAVVEADNEVNRIKEELQLLPKEMRAHITYWKKLLQQQQNLEARLQETVDNSAAGSDTVAAEVRNAGYVPLPGQGRYQPTVQQMLQQPAVLGGAISYLRAAQDEVNQQLQKALKIFVAAGVTTGSGDILYDSDVDVNVDSEDGELPPPAAARSGDAP